ncbi:PAS domain S-box protein, partial [Paenibacillus sp.]|uniref:PAS domain S-box protein n=1 Tax=Paenibacillus sp. TaxID=58172 RepID=UPI00346409C8
EEYIRNALERKKPLFYESKFGSRTIIKGFIPIIGTTAYVLNISMDARTLVEALHDQLMRNVAVGIVLLEIVLIGSYMLSGILIRPLQSILNKINMISVGHFNTQLNIDRNDELGILAQRINTMARNLDASTERLRMSYLENRAMKEHLESFINQSNDAIHVTDLKGRIERVNQAFVDMFGWTSEEVLGKPLCNIPEDKLEEERKIHEAKRHGEYVSNWETTRLTKDGRVLDVSVTTSPMYNEGGDCIAWASITRDITSRKRMEELLRRSEKLTTVGQLAAGVAHEIRNPLTTLKGFLQLQQRTRSLNDNHMDMMLAELERINLIVSEFLVLAKPQAIQFQPKDVRRIVTDVVALLDSQANLNNVHFATQFDEFVPLVNCEENQLKQVFINVMKNAMEAMPEGGMVEIAVQSRHKGLVVVKILDHGIGIPEEHLSQLGDPFFTSKEYGTGLGLMVSQRIIHNHRGLIEITSEQNIGTEVTISLPAIGVEEEGSGDLTVPQPTLTAISS